VRILHAKVAMRDGVRLCVNVFRPASPARVPAVLFRTPYGKPAEPSASQFALLRAGYALVVQDVRGRYHSEAAFRPVVSEARDAEDTLSWIVRQEWSDGNVAMTGGSYSGIAQWKAALTGHPALKAIAPVVSGNDEYLDRYYSPGGAFRLAHRLVWVAENLRAPGFALPDLRRLVEHTPLRTADRAATNRTLDFFQEVLDHPANDSFWRTLSTRDALESVRAPALIYGGWYDPAAPSDLASFRRLRELGRAVRLTIGPWGHNMSVTGPGLEFGPAARLPVRSQEIEWFDAHLRRRPLAPAAPLRYFVTGANRWAEGAAWPPPLVGEAELFLDNAGALVDKRPARSGAYQYVYDPRQPVPSLGGALCCNYEFQRWGPLDQRPVETRPDVALFTTAPLKGDLEIAGAIRAILWVRSDAPDTDFTAKLTDVDPGGASRWVADGILRLRYRRGLDSPEAYVPGTLATIEIDLGAAAHVFAAGHRLRLAVSSSNFPRFDRNPNTGRAVAAETALRAARQTVHWGAHYASRLLLPVVAAPKSGTVSLKEHAARATGRRSHF
jgi:putative CocE/NonD family hydrolase